MCVQPAWAGEPRCESLLGRSGVSTALVQQCPLKIPGRNPYFLTQLHQIGFSESITDVTLGSLQLGRTLYDPLQRLAVDPLLIGKIGQVTSPRR